MERILGGLVVEASPRNTGADGGEGFRGSGLMRSPLRGRQRHADALDRLVEPEGTGRAADEDQGQLASDHRFNPQDSCHAPLHVGRWLQLPTGITGGGA